jgi:outer membrane receptor protein involved in Fe transport
VPGFEFGIDILSLFGLGFRGIWAHEGKALVMINNTPINCFGYGNNNYFGSLPSAMIDHIEIIRGPGSTLYGGFAEVAVINVITKKGARLRGAEITTWVGAMSMKELIRGGNLSAGMMKEQMDLSVHVGTNFTPTSIRTYTDYAGKSFQMGSHSSWRKWSHIIAEGSFHNFYFSYNRSEQLFLAEDIFGFLSPNPTAGIYSNQLNFRIETFRAHYEFWAGKVRLKPNIEMSRGIPISTSSASISYPNVSPTTYLIPSNIWQNASIDARKYQAELELQYTISEDNEILAGIGAQNNLLYAISVNGSNALQTSANPADTTSFVARPTFYGFAQYTRQGKEFGFTTGARFENTPFGNAFLPRMGFTYVKQKFNTKLLYGRAFRVPLLYQAYTREYARVTLNPEITHTFDLEVGYKITTQSYLRANAFHTQISDPITYLSSTNSYQNYGSVRTVGAEAEYKWQNKAHQFFMNLAYSRPIKGFTNADFMNQSANAFLALPTLKVNVGGSFTYKKLILGSTATWLSPRHAQTQNSALVSTPTEVLLETQKYPALLLCNLNILWTEAFVKNLTLRLTGYNILNASYLALQPYYGAHAPMPVNDRQVDLAVIIKL